ncbi:thioredoxin family protein [Parachlamydia sp. AcF125]|uniref:thioredoxin family protein n=1 Tax=Parachlamydia sp. AcF125 TaxID=2795736 RepID=UPI001BD8A02B|nr:thioredoxin family protein [Parachlamydia sp. AcF125]MBS4168797.1 Disulfide bond reductase DsbH [Parachlamydia sp. AcF125]
MMKQLSFIVLTALAFCWLSSAQAASATSPLQWHENYAEAAKLSASSGKPLFVLFTGSDWCTYCIKLENEVFATPEFAKALGNRLIFVKLDYPPKASVPVQIKEQNEALKRKFNIQGFPTVVLLDSKGGQIGVTGYKTGGGKIYADHIQKLLDNHSAYLQKMDTLQSHKLAGVS